jgi:hypothetical protein
MVWKLVSVLLVAAAVCGALTPVFRAEPRTAAWSGWTELGSYNYVSEIITLNVDDLGAPGYVELFVGDLGSAPGAAFQVEVFEHPGGITRVAYSNQQVVYTGHTWVRFPLLMEPGATLTKGRRYEFRFSRANGAKLNYYCDYCATRYDRA